MRDNNSLKESVTILNVPPICLRQVGNSSSLSPSFPVSLMLFFFIPAPALFSDEDEEIFFSGSSLSSPSFLTFFSSVSAPSKQNKQKL